MMAAIDLDMALEVITEGVELTRVFAAETRDEFREHVGNQIFSAEGEGRGDFMRLAVGRQGEGGAGERGGTRRDTSGNKSGGSGASCTNGGERLVDGGRIRASLMHRAQVEVEVRDTATARVDVGFFTADDLVDQEAHLGIADGYPRDVHAGEVALQTLQKRHEIPDREDMRTHKHADVVERGHPGIQRVREQAGTGWRDAGADEVNSTHANELNRFHIKASGRAPSHHPDSRIWNIRLYSAVNLS